MPQKTTTKKSSSASRKTTKAVSEARRLHRNRMWSTVLFIIGIFLIFKPAILNEFLGIIIGAWLIIQFIIKFQFAFNLKSLALPVWSLMLISSLLHLILGILMIFNPFGSMIAITTLAGIILLVTEVGNIIESFYLLFKS